MSTRARALLGWIPAVLISVFMVVASGLPKLFAGNIPELMDFARQLGTQDFMVPLGIVEILVAVLWLIPRFATVGFVILIGFLGGATATNLTHGLSAAFPFGMMLLATFSAYFRSPELLSRLYKKPVPAKI